jgi:hypothetical protein
MSHSPAPEILPWNPLSSYLRNRFGGRVSRIPVDAGFTCPNRDGTLGTGGCTFCGEEGARAAFVNLGLPVKEQIAAGIRRANVRYGAEKYLVYFQAYSNTYGTAEQLRELYDTALSFNGVVGIMAGTRPDCLPGSVLNVIGEYARKTWFTVELGAQSMHDAALARVNRGHSAADTTHAVQALRASGADVLAHVILGLPGETGEMMLESVRVLDSLGIRAWKFHQLMVERGTAMEADLQNGTIAAIGLENYCDVLSEALALISPDAVIHRLFGTSDPERLLAPLWTLDRNASENRLLKAMRAKNYIQGCLHPAGGHAPRN